MTTVRKVSEKNAEQARAILDLQKRLARLEHGKGKAHGRKGKRNEEEE